MDIPAGFEPFDGKSPVTEPWEPIYCRKTPDAVVLAVRLARAHTNARGFAHGGFISAIADNAMGHSVVTKLQDETRSAVTVNLAVDSSVPPGSASGSNSRQRSSRPAPRSALPSAS